MFRGIRSSSVVIVHRAVDQRQERVKVNLSQLVKLIVNITANPRPIIEGTIRLRMGINSNRNDNRKMIIVVK